MNKKIVITSLAAAALAGFMTMTPMHSGENSTNTVVQAAKVKKATYTKLFGKKHSKDPYIEKWRKQIVKHAYYDDGIWCVTLIATKTLHDVEEENDADIQYDTSLIANKGDQVILSYPKVTKSEEQDNIPELKNNWDDGGKLKSSNKNLDYSFYSDQSDTYFNVTCFKFGSYNPAKDKKLKSLSRKVRKDDFKVIPKHSNVTVYEEEGSGSDMPISLTKSKTMTKATAKTDLYVVMVKGQYYYTNGTNYWNVKDVTLKK